MPVIFRLLPVVPGGYRVGFGYSDNVFVSPSAVKAETDETNVTVTYSNLQGIATPVQNREFWAVKIFLLMAKKPVNKGNFRLWALFSVAAKSSRIPVFFGW